MTERNSTQIICPHGCGEMINGVQGDPLEPEDPYCPDCSHIDGHDCDNGCDYSDPTIFCRLVGHNINAVLQLSRGQLAHRCTWCGHLEYTEQSSSRETQTTMLQALADPIVRYISPDEGGSDER